MATKVEKAEDIESGHELRSGQFQETFAKACNATKVTSRDGEVQMTKAHKKSSSSNSTNPQDINHDPDDDDINSDFISKYAPSVKRTGKESKEDNLSGAASSAGGAPKAGAKNKAKSSNVLKDDDDMFGFCPMTCNMKEIISKCLILFQTNKNTTT